MEDIRKINGSIWVKEDLAALTDRKAISGRRADKVDSSQSAQGNACL